MPLIVPKPGAEPTLGEKLTPDAELFVVCGWGKCGKRLDRVLKKKPDVNRKSPGDGKTPLHNAAMCGSAEFCKKLLAAKADPNVPATEGLFTPLEWVLAKIAYEEERDRRLNDFDTVNRLDDTSLAVRPDLKPYKEVKAVLEGAGAVVCGALEKEPTIKPDGSIKGGAPSALRAYELGPDGSYTAAAHLRSGKYDALKYEDGKLIECEYDPRTGRWDGFDEGRAIVGA
eukprot:CAMPEP_0198493152 /NCGR_PEP_ID=MMETSP1462-20131121/3847_1 /TAXON_ID=1333877 /ORGANISM="Brandtodinium nutriculum, Strain RCC3387" /LENGTH=227 /DNA_ID=CAMNT_0044221829 /DNA_START=42 /DNA_END=725 /DNA_ORIENTATION=-